MHDVLNAIRRLYGERGDSAPGEMTPEEKAEFAAMADLKAALGMPEASAVDVFTEVRARRDRFQ